MRPDELRALAEALADEDFELRDSPMSVRRQWAAYLLDCAEAKPAGTVWYHRGLPNFDDSDALRLSDDGTGKPIPLYAHPAPAAPHAEPKREPTCLWSRADDDTDVWETSCRHAFTIIEGGPTDNQMAYCCYCGRPLDEEIGGSDAE